MKNAIKSTLAMTAASLLMAAPAFAFHDGGVAACESCHTMHNSKDGAALKTTGGITQFKTGPYLLQGSTQSEACLNCHEGSAGSYKVSTAGTTLASGTLPLQMTPGGDFSWLKKA